MKVCIWCRNNESNVSFNNEAHTVPKSLGGKKICENVCDNCNHYFGKNLNGVPSIETIIKETFNITRARLLNSQNKIGKNKSMAKYSSTFFKIDFQNNKVSLKPSFKLKKSFQYNLGRLLKRGIYKMFLEETERQFKDGLNPKYDFIREFSKYNIGNYPIFYYQRKIGIIASSDEMIENPMLFLDEKYKFQYLYSDASFTEFEFLGHVLGITTSRIWDLNVSNYLKNSMIKKDGFFIKYKQVESFNDIDFTLSIIK